MTTAIPPQLFTYADGVMRPRWPDAVAKYYKEGERYLLVPHEQRSVRSHNHFFAAVAEAHANLPEDLAERFPSPDHLRAFALIKTGFCDQQQTVMQTAEDASMMAAVLRTLDGYSIVSVNDCVVTRFTAKSQSYRTMNKAEFSASKKAVLDYISGLIGVAKEDLEKNSGGAA